jgi:hypothetical protein
LEGKRIFKIKTKRIFKERAEIKRIFKEKLEKKEYLKKKIKNS